MLYKGAAVGVVIVAAGAACAHSVTIHAFDRGWYNQSGFHDPTNDNYFVGDTTGNAEDMGELRNWFVFDLTGVTARELIGARLELPNSFWFTDTGSETLRLTGVSVDRASLMDGTGGVGAFGSLGTGPLFGEFTRTGFQSGPVVVNLNALFLDSVPYGGWVVLGGRLTTLQPRGAMFGSSGGIGPTPRLVLDDGLPPAPMPSAAAMVAATLVLAAGRRRRRVG
jgi:hypothetical protein